MTKVVVVLAGASVLIGSASTVGAQQPAVAELVPKLMAESAVLAAGATGDHAQHFAPTPADLQPFFALNRVLALQIGSFSFGPSVLAPTPPGTDGRRRPAAGGAAAHAAQTIGRGQLALAVGYQATTFDTIDGLALRDSAVKVFIPHGASTGTASDRDLLRQTISLRMNRKITTLAVTYGWRERVDIGVDVPIVQVAADARITTQIVRTGSSVTPAVHQFDPIGLANRTLPRFCSQAEAIAADALQCRGSSTARGIGDVALRAKYVLAGNSPALAFGLEAGLPTGRSDDFMGVGAFQLRPSVTWSGAAGRVVPRARVEYVRSQGKLSAALAGDIDRTVPDETLVAGGLDTQLAPAVVAVLDVVARRVNDVAAFSRGTTIFPGRGLGTPPSPYLAEDALQVGDSRAIMQTAIAVGLRATAPGAVLLQLSVVVPVGSDGLRPGPMAVFSLAKSR